MPDSKKSCLNFAIFILVYSVAVSVIAGTDPENSNIKNIQPGSKDLGFGAT